MTENGNGMIMPVAPTGFMGGDGFGANGGLGFGGFATPGMQQQAGRVNVGLPGATGMQAGAAAGRGMDIKLDEVSLKSGGLHVIIPYSMENNRVLEQCIGRCGRQGQPGSATLYVRDDDPCYATKDFDNKFEALLRLQNQFADYIIGY